MLALATLIGGALRLEANAQGNIKELKICLLTLVYLIARTLGISYFTTKFQGMITNILVSTFAKIPLPKFIVILAAQLGM